MHFWDKDKHLSKKCSTESTLDESKRANRSQKIQNAENSMSFWYKNNTNQDVNNIGSLYLMTIIIYR